MINGTFDWVYEEELMNYYADGWRWSPDGRSIAYWQLNADRVRNFDLVNNTDSLYSRVIPVQYPKVGEENSAARVGIVPAAGGATRWLEIEGDPREHYIPRMDWAAGSDEVILQRLNRLQNTDEVMLGDARTGQVRTVLTERDSTWVDVVDDLVWLKGGKEFTWVSERDGWKHVYAVSRDGKSVRLVTPGDFDVLEVKGIDDKGGWLYYVASPDNPTQKYLFRTRLDGKGKAERISPGTEPGTHAYDRAPNFKVAIETYSSLGNPPVIRLVRLPGNQVIRTLVDNAPLRARVAGLRRGQVEWLTIPTAGWRQNAGSADEAGGLRLDAPVPVAVLRVRRPGQRRGRGSVGRVLALAHDAHAEGLSRGHRGQPGHARAARPRLAQGDLRTARRARDARTRRSPPGRCSSGRSSIPAGSASGAGATGRS